MKRVLFLMFLIAFGLSPLHTAAAQSEAPPSFEKLTFPESIGKIEDRFTGSSPRWVIYIQDVHAHFTAQENIATLLEQLNANGGISTVATEGSWSATSYPQTWGIPPTPEKQNLLRALLEKEYISGPAYAAMFSKMPITLIGMEDARVYEKNRAYYLKFLDTRDSVVSRLQDWESRLSEEKKKMFNPELLDFDLLFSKFQGGEPDKKTLPLLLQWADKKRVPLTGYGELSLFRQMTDLEKSIQKTKLESEAKRLMTEYKNERMDFENLLASGQIPQDKLEHYPEAKKYLALTDVRARISHRELLEEIGRFGEDIKEKLFRSDAERSLDAEDRRMRTAKQLILFKATPEDFSAYEKERVKLEEEAAGARLSEALENAVGFYRTAKERDDIFFKKITEDPRLKNNIAVVAGGFHTEGLTGKLKQAGISYLVVAPALGKESPNEELYFERLRETLPQAQASALSAKQNRENDDQDARIAATLRGLTSKKITDLRKAVDLVATGTGKPRPALQTGAPLPGPKTGFAGLSPERQLEQVRLFRDKQNGHQRIVIILKASTLAGLIVPQPSNGSRDPELALAIWKDLMENRANNVILLNDNESAYQQILGNTFGKSVKRIPGNDLDAVIEKEKGKNIPVGVIDPGYAGTQEVLALKPAPASLFLIRPLLEDKQSRELFSVPEAVQALQKILTGLLLGEWTQKSA